MSVANLPCLDDKMFLSILVEVEYRVDRLHQLFYMENSPDKFIRSKFTFTKKEGM